MYLFVSMYVYVGICGGQKRAPDTLEPELQEVLSQ